MPRSLLLLAIASVLAGTTALLVALGAVYNPILIIFAVPFAIAAYFLWSHATGRLGTPIRSNDASFHAWFSPEESDRTRRHRHTKTTHSGNQRTDSAAAPRAGYPSRAEARAVLGVEPDADTATIRRAYRERVKRAHPDTDGGSEAAFKRIQDSYNRLRDE